MNSKKRFQKFYKEPVEIVEIILYIQEGEYAKTFFKFEKRIIVR